MARIAAASAARRVRSAPAAVHYLEAIGRRMAAGAGLTRRAALAAAMRAIADYERILSAEMIAALKRKGATIHGINDEQALDRRVPTICFTLPGSFELPLQLKGALQRLSLLGSQRLDAGLREGDDLVELYDLLTKRRQLVDLGSRDRRQDRG